MVRGHAQPDLELRACDKVIRSKAVKAQQPQLASA
eukprot:CAMPEP_0119328078 /NCGR_PEP_ID=MMETSP1333-20130426/72375_1 /TAXON_ID=418940 /ORGANISM="Scyphosphaera apsteinii, Strain RCC1455" /LENGTH=34 /DNA_ID= /DNA_START= /DNA_END= /DNA_ORIENTATION=